MRTSNANSTTAQTPSEKAEDTITAREQWLEKMASKKLPAERREPDLALEKAERVDKLFTPILQIARANSESIPALAPAFHYALERIISIAKDPDEHAAFITEDLRDTLSDENKATTLLLLQHLGQPATYIEERLSELALHKKEVAVISSLLIREIRALIKEVEISLDIHQPFGAPSVWKTQELQDFLHAQGCSIFADYCKSSSLQELLATVLIHTNRLADHDAVQVLMSPRLVRLLLTSGNGAEEALNGVALEYARRRYMQFDSVISQASAGNDSVINQLALYERVAPIASDIGGTLMEWTSKGQTLNKTLVQALQFLRPETTPLIIITGGDPHSSAEQLRKANIPQEFPYPISKDRVKGCYIPVAIDDQSPLKDGYAAGIHAVDVKDLLRKDPWGQLAAYRERLAERSNS
jgi:hypothetical protein